MNKKEMGIAVRALDQYASVCLSVGAYIEMRKALEIARNIASTYELKEEEMINESYVCYMNEALSTLKDEIKKGEEAQKIYNKLIHG